MLDRIHPEDVNTARSRFYGLAEPVQRIELEHRIVMQDASVKHLNILGKAEREKDGRLRISAAVMDITDARRTAELLRKSQAELAHVTRLTTMGELVASIAHEINQPLGAMKLHAQSGLRWLDREPPELERAEMSLNRVIDNAVRAEGLIAKIRGMAKKQEAESVPIDLNHLVGDVMEFLKGEAHERGVACQIDLEPSLGEVRGDPIQLQQILVNFLMNGFDAMAATPREEREITIRSRNRGKRGNLRRAGRRPRDSAGGGGSPVRRLLHHQGPWNGNGTLDLPLNRRGPPAAGSRPSTTADRGATFRLTVAAERDIEVSWNARRLSSRRAVEADGLHFIRRRPNPAAQNTRADQGSSSYGRTRSCPLSGAECGVLCAASRRARPTDKGRIRPTKTNVRHRRRRRSDRLWRTSARIA